MLMFGVCGWSGKNEGAFGSNWNVAAICANSGGLSSPGGEARCCCCATMFCKRGNVDVRTVVRGNRLCG